MLQRTASKQGNEIPCQPVPLTLAPSPFPRRLFDQAVGLQPLMNLLYYRVSLDRDFIVNSLHGVAKTDDFIRHLLAIYVSVMDDAEAQRRQRGVLVIQRADYMRQKPSEKRVNTGGEGELKQIEVNNICGYVTWSEWQF